MAHHVDFSASLGIGPFDGIQQMIDEQIGAFGVLPDSGHVRFVADTP